MMARKSKSESESLSAEKVLRARLDAHDLLHKYGYTLPQIAISEHAPISLPGFVKDAWRGLSSFPLKSK
jgi:hypothetical protein